MKRLIGATVALVLCVKSFTQVSYLLPNDVARVYFTYEDFRKRSLANSFLPQKKAYTLWPKGFFRYGDLVWKTPDSSIRYKRSAIWGFIDHRSYFYRMYRNRYFKLLCDKGINLYIVYSPTKTVYYFSESYNSPIYAVTKKNLLKVIDKTEDVYKKVKATRKREWLNWDNASQSYRINQFFIDKKSD